jgi:hypothetical protein
LHVIELLLNTIEPLIHVGDKFLNPIIHFPARDVVPGDFLARPVQQDADPGQLIELAFKQEPHEAYHRC